MSEIVQGRTPWNFRSKPKVFLNLLNTDFKCSSKLNLESKIIPKYLQVVMNLIMLLLNIKCE